MATDPRERHRFLARQAPGDRTPILAAGPAVKSGDGVATLRLYDPIDSWGGEWGVSANEFADTLDALGPDVTEIQLHLNSPGGEVFEGIAILNLLRQHKAKVVVTIDGLAASAASFVAMAGDEVVMAENSELMIHDAWGAVVGNATDLREVADRLDHLSSNIAGAYASKAGGTVETWRAAMLAETWYSAQEAVDAGLADRVQTAKPADVAAAKARFDLSAFNHAGRAQAPAPTAPISPSASGSSTEIPEESMSLTDAQVTDLCTRLGIADENADGDTILAALDEALSEQSTTHAPPDGMALVDAAALAELRVMAQSGAEARQEQVRAHRESLVKAAVADGRIPPARREAWLNLLATDSGAEATLASLEPGLIPVAGPAGHAGQPESNDDDAVFAALFPSEMGV